MQHYLNKRNQAFSLKTVCQIGIRLIEMFECIHDLGLVYNDLKLDNILVGDKNDENLHQIRMIDFGLTTPYLDANGDHIKEEQGDFIGNLAFSSKNAMNYKTLSRRDDLISLTYLLLYIYQGRLEILNFQNDENPENQFQAIRLAKNQATPDELCKSKKAKVLLEFVEEIHSLAFNETPNYKKLKFMMVKCMLAHDIILSDQFDWTPPEQLSPQS